MTTAWMVRAGGYGEREERALSESKVLAGWHETGDLSPYTTRESLRDYLNEVYPDASPAVLSNWTGQLWKFTQVISEGDLVVLPLKLPGTHVAIGRISGPYQFEKDAPTDFRHVRPVEWINTHVDRGAIEKDLLDSLGSLLTVCELSRHNAAERIDSLAQTEKDPGWTPVDIDSEAIANPKSLFAAAQAQEHGPMQLSVRQLLGAFGHSRRTGPVVSEIESALAENGLTAVPSITNGWLDSVISLHLLRPVSEDPTEAPDAPLSPVSLRVGSLECANTAVVSVNRDDTLERAYTLMLANDFSQLAVLDPDEKLCGTVSWESLGRARVAHPEATLADACVTPRTVDTGDHLLSIVDIVYDRGFVLVTDTSTSGIRGIITAADLTQQFGEMARPFALIEEAERRLRRRVDETFPRTKIERFKSPGGKPAQSAADLTLGKYPLLLSAPEDFAHLGWRLDQELFISHLRQIKNLRNELMHFSTDPLSEASLRPLVNFVEMLRTVDPRP